MREAGDVLHGRFTGMENAVDHLQALHKLLVQSLQLVRELEKKF
jgi:hypothetical protein